MLIGNLVKVIKILVEKLDGIFGFDVAYAHCDIPCGIYDPHMMQMAARFK